MKKLLLFVFLVASLGAAGQTANQYIIPQKNVGAGNTNRFVSPDPGMLMMWNGTLMGTMDPATLATVEAMEDSLDAMRSELARQAALVDTAAALRGDLMAEEEWAVGVFATHADLGDSMVNVVRTNRSYGNPSWITALAWSKLTGVPSFATVATSGAYSDLTGKPTIPTNTNQLTNGAGFITGISSGDVTTALGFTPYNATNPSSYINQAGARGAISLTTTGSSGAATYNSSTGVLNVPNYTPSAAPGTNNATAYAAGTVYALTTTPAKVDFGTTDPVITLPAAGTYLITSNVRVSTTGLTALATDVSFKLRRTNNTAADIANATAVANIPAATLLTSDVGDADVASVIYTTANNNDVIEIWGSRSTAITIGNINVTSAHIVAVRIY